MGICQALIFSIAKRPVFSAAPLKGTRKTHHVGRQRKAAAGLPHSKNARFGKRPLQNKKTPAESAVHSYVLSFFVRYLDFW
jgi:hypothetical protein